LFGKWIARSFGGANVVDGRNDEKRKTRTGNAALLGALPFKRAGMTRKGHDRATEKPA
jgi:hypothetical protein